MRPKNALTIINLMNWPLNCRIIVYKDRRRVEGVKKYDEVLENTEIISVREMVFQGND